MHFDKAFIEKRYQYQRFYHRYDSTKIESKSN